MKIIFITNENKLVDLLNTENVSAIKNNMEKLDDGYFCYSKNINNHSVYILYDGEGNGPLDDEDREYIIPLFNDLIMNNNDYFIIYHTNQSQDFDNILANVPNERKYQGMHEENHEKSKYYQKLPEILEKGENASYSALDNLVEELKKKINEDNSLETKLNFLHQCLTPDGLKDATLKDEWNAESEFKNLKNVIDGPFGNDYLEALRSLRDKLWAN